MSNFFPILRLPPIVLNEVVKEYNPIEFPYSSRKSVESFIPWMNKTNLDIENIHISFHREHLCKFFWENYKGPIKGLETQIGGDLDIPLTLKFDYLHADWGGQILKLEQLYPLNCKDINMGYVQTSNEEVNLFLKNWKEGKSNNGLKRIRFYNWPVDWNVILKGLEPKVRDLRTTKRKYEKIIIKGDATRVSWINGGLDIQREDGTIATIFHLCFVSSEENTEIPQPTIDYFEKYRDKDWNSGEVEIEEETLAEQEARRMDLLMRRDLFEMNYCHSKPTSICHYLAHCQEHVYSSLIIVLVHSLIHIDTMTDFFPILHLPLIVLHDVLQKWSPIELKTIKTEEFKGRGASWINGGLEIQREDGTIATIFHLCFISSEENTEIPQLTIDYFEKYRDKDWNSGEVEIEEDGDAEKEGRRLGRLMPIDRFELVVFDPNNHIY
uniref:FBA_2 domain-containing protein n=1 Tax=Caenorhabditis tropicalis TaxID=1561998 RepID=A0A1I7UZS4_9PELO